MKLSRTARAAAAGVAAALLLSSCGSTAPGVAADVDGNEITDQQVDDFALVLCSLGGLPSTPSGVPSKGAVFRSLQILLSSEIAHEMADVDAVDKSLVSTSLEQLNQTRDLVPEDVRPSFDEVALDFATTQNAILELGRASLEEQGQSDVADEDAFAEGERLRTEYAAQADISVDPRYGTMVDGVLTPSDGSLSVPVSPTATGVSVDAPTDAAVAALPASQKCD